MNLFLHKRADFKGYEKKGFYHFGLYIEKFDYIIEKCTKMGIEIFYGGLLKREKSASIYICTILIDFLILQ
ncbi:hypothetical protein BMS3Abin03_02767 [bacterium BMS3Abin03]|nr:hypothetical protein BMS3Abin03_02767 [bacterium BMS3Abin03]